MWGSAECGGLLSLTVAGQKRPVVRAVRVQLAAFRRSFAGRPLHEELVGLVKGALLGSIQRLALGLERTPGPLPESLPFARNERGTVFGFSGLESPERVRLSALRAGRAVIRIHGCHVAV